MQENPEKDVGLDAVLFDFGGVLAEEGFREGLKEIARRNRLDPETFYRLGSEAVYDSGYVVGKADEKAFWDLLCRRSGLGGYDADYTKIILERFRLRPSMLRLVRELKSLQVRVAILSDQTDWLDRLEERHRFYYLFERVFNSYHVGMSKRDPEVFLHALGELEVEGERTLFVDDSEGHVERASGLGLRTLLFREPASFFESIGPMLAS